MRIWHLVTARLRAILMRRRVEADLEEELRLHVERDVEQRVASGIAADEARRLTLVAFGGVEQIKEDCRDARGLGLVDILYRDTRHGARRLVRDWRFTAAAVLILGLAIGANTATFSLVNTALFRRQAFAEPERLVEIYQNYGEARFPLGTSYPAYRDMTEYTDVFVSITAASVFPWGVSYQHEGGVRPAAAQYSSATYLSVLGLRPSQGRWFDEAEDAPGREIVAVVGHQSWKARFGADPSLLGRTIRVNGVPVTIVGVGPERHNSTLNAGMVTDFWLPISAMPALGAPPRALARRPEEPGLVVKARLRDGVTVAQAQAAMDGLGDRLAAEFPNEDPGRGITVLPASEVRIHPQIDAALAPMASILLIVVGLVLAIACSNLATLLLVRGSARAKEVAVRLALGASRGQLVRHLLTESLVLSAAGGIAGCVIAWWAIQSVSALNLPLIVDLTVDYRVLGFAVVLSLATGVLFGLAPALKATRIDVLPALRDEGAAVLLGRRWFSLKNGLVVFQVVVSFVLLAGTSLFLQLIFAARMQNVGFATDGVAMLRVDARYAGYSPARAQAVYEDLRQRVAALPAVESAVLSLGAPMQSTGSALIIESADLASDAGSAVVPWMWAGPGFFETLRIPILYGRTFDDRDRLDTPHVAVINDSMARRYFGGMNAVGRRFRFDDDPDSWMEVIGVVRDTGTADLTDHLMMPGRPSFFRSHTQADAIPSTVLARTSLDAASLVGAMQRELRALDAALPIVTAQTMEQHLESSLFAYRAATGFLGALGALGLSLASIGLYAVVSFAVSRRAREVAIRIALGARSRQVIWVVAREVAALVCVGIGLGLTMSLLGIGAVNRLTVSAPNIQLYRPTVDPVALLSIALLMTTVGILAAYIPARRATAVDPLVALRQQ